VYTPETWQLRLTDVDPAVVEAIRRASRDGAFGR
jgi:RecB family exonuclease